MKIAVVILAGGKSNRLGTDKAFLRWQGKPLLLQIVERFRNFGFSVIVAGGPQDWAQRLKGIDAPIVADLPAHEGFGPLAGIEAGFLQTDAKLLGVVACDLPFADPKLLSWLSEQIGDADAVVPLVGDEPQPLHAIYSRSSLPHLVAQLESQDRSVKGFLKRLKVVWVDEAKWKEVADPSCLRAHLNEPEDLERWGVFSQQTKPERHALRFPLPVLAFVGFSNSGKTTVMEQLLQRLKAKGYKVAVIKHHHGQIDTHGKDTWRFQQAGAEAVVLVASDGFALLSPKASLTAEQAIKHLTKHFPVDLVLVEGFKGSSLPKFVVLPPKATTEEARQLFSQLMAQIEDKSTVVGLIGHIEATLDLPQFSHDEIDRLCEFVEQWARENRFFSLGV